MRCSCQGLEQDESNMSIPQESAENGIVLHDSRGAFASTVQLNHYLRKDKDQQYHFTERKPLPQKTHRPTHVRYVSQILII